ncbi:MAG: putative ATP binding domain 1 family member B, partial [Streblomastix strix]
MEYLCKNLDWLDQELEKFKGFYLLFDFPGQVEFFVMCDASRFISGLLLSLTGMLMVGLPHLNVLTKVDLIKQYGDTILPLEFFTSIPETGPILACLLDQNVDNSNQSTSHNTHQSSSSQTNFSSSELSYSIMNKKKLSPYASLNARVAEMAVDYALVGFKLMSVKDEVSVAAVAAAADKANGFIFTNDGALQNRQIGSIPGVTKELDESD